MTILSCFPYVFIAAEHLRRGITRRRQAGGLPEHRAEAGCEFAYELPQELDTIIGEEGHRPFGWPASAPVPGACPESLPCCCWIDTFSALDVDTEERIINGLREGLEGLGGATTLLTAPPSTVALADRACC